MAASISASSPRTACLRELAEESGYEGEIERLLDASSRVFTDSHGAAVHAVGVFYRVRIIGGELRDEVDGSTDTCAWFTPDEAAALDIVDLVRRVLPMATARPADMHSTIGIDIAAPPALVFALARDPERWARLLPHYARSRAVGAGGRTVRRSSTSWRAGRSSTSSGWPCRSPGGPAHGQSRPPFVSASSTSPVRPGGWT